MSRLIKPLGTLLGGSINRTPALVKDGIDFLVFSGGFDCTLVKTDCKSNKIVKRVDMNEILAANSDGPLQTPAFIYDIHIGCLANDVLVSLETGHVVSFQSKNPSQVRYILDGHRNKVLHS